MHLFWLYLASMLWPIVHYLPLEPSLVYLAFTYGFELHQFFTSTTPRFKWTRVHFFWSESEFDWPPQMKRTRVCLKWTKQSWCESTLRLHIVKICVSQLESEQNSYITTQPQSQPAEIVARKTQPLRPTCCSECYWILWNLTVKTNSRWCLKCIYLEKYEDS